MANPYIQSLQTSQPSGGAQPQTTTSNPYIRSISPQVQISEPAPKKSLAQKVQPYIEETKPIAKGLFEGAKGFIKSVPGFIKASAKHPTETYKGILEEEIISFGGAVTGYIQKGITSAVGIKVPERWDILKQRQAWKELRSTEIAKKPEDVRKAIETGRFIGSFIPYPLGSELAGLTIGARATTPIITKFIPKVKFLIPRINNIVGFTGVGQLEYDKEIDGTRVDRLKNDVIMLGLFEAGGVLAKGLSKATSKIVSKTYTDVAGKLKSKKPVAITDLEKKVIETKEAIANDTGRPANVTLAENITKASEKELEFVSVPKSETIAQEAKIQLQGIKKEQIETVKDIKDVKRTLRNIREEIDSTIVEAEGKTALAKEQRGVFSSEESKNISKLKSIYWKSDEFQGGDIGTMQKSKHGPLLSRVIENIQ